MRVLVACEESQRVCTAFRERGHIAYSCDIIECSGGHPEYHILGDALEILNGGTATLQTGKKVEFPEWDLIIAHPPCTYLCVSGNRWFNTDKYGVKAVERKLKRYSAMGFFLAFTLANCPKICIENPIGYMNSHYRKPDQIIQPYFFGDPYSKSTCLWLQGLPPLVPDNIVNPLPSDKYGFTVGGALQHATRNGKIIAWNDPETKKQRSKTFPGIARAMAEQWG